MYIFFVPTCLDEVCFAFLLFLVIILKRTLWSSKCEQTECATAFSAFNTINTIDSLCDFPNLWLETRETETYFFSPSFWKLKNPTFFKHCITQVSNQGNRGLHIGLRNDLMLLRVDINLQSFWSNWCSEGERNTSCCDVLFSCFPQAVVMRVTPPHWETRSASSCDILTPEKTDFSSQQGCMSAKKWQTQKNTFGFLFVPWQNK